MDLEIFIGVKCNEIILLKWDLTSMPDGSCLAGMIIFFLPENESFIQTTERAGSHQNLPFHVGM